MPSRRLGDMFNKPTFIGWKNSRKILTALLTLVLLLIAALPATAASSKITVFFNGQLQNYKPAPRIINNRVFVPMRDIFEALGAEVSWDDNTRTANAYKDGKYVSVQIGNRVGISADATVADGQYELHNVQKVNLDAAPAILDNYTMVPLRFISESLGANVQWFNSTRQIYINTDGTVTPPPMVDSSEMRGVWISFNDLAQFDTTKIDAILNKAVDMKLNTVFVHARAFSDAFYKSQLFPWSHMLTGVQGQAIDIDPLQYVVTAGHQRGLQVDAWINPYRISTSTTLSNSLSADNPAVKWLNDPAKVIHYQANGQNCLIYNPASQEVRDLITAGVVEIVNNYDVDGIHFDDYFYVSGMKEAYDTAAKEKEVNKLVQQVYTAVKSTDPALRFGISPAGNIANCNAAGADVQSWLSQDGYVDYVCPQIYWSNEYKTPKYQFNNCLNEWLALKKNNNVKLYVGLALYRVGTSSSTDPGWINRNDNMLTQVQSLRSSGQCAGFILFSAPYLQTEQTQTELANLKAIL
ncbi:MAG: family 10 glycosylhydrolase [Methanobacterium sp.]